MKDDEKEKVEPEESENQLVGFLLRIAGSRPAVPDEVRGRVQSAVHTHWKRTLRVRLYRKWIFSIGAGVAASALFYVLALQFVVGRDPKAVPLGFVNNLNGTVVIHEDSTENPSGRPLKSGDMLMSATTLETGESGRVLIQVLGGTTLRLDVQSRLQLQSESSVVLHSGAVYIDSERSPRQILLQTSFGTVRDIGTQFEVRLATETIRIRVREGSVSLERNGISRPAVAGTELAVNRNNSASTRNIPRYGDQWDWVSVVAPSFYMEGRSLLEFLNWVTRENGWSLRFEEQKIQATAAKTILHGSIVGIPPQLTPDVVLPVCGVRYSLVDGVLTIKPRESR